MAATGSDANRAGDRHRWREPHAEAPWPTWRGGAAGRVAPAARERNADARRAIAALLDRGEALYGATTGVGALRDRSIGDADRERFQWNLLRSHAVSAGRPLNAELVRAGMVVRANQLGPAAAGVTPALLDALIAALNAGVVPLTRELGSLGTGDLPGLAEVALALLGEGKVWRDGELVDAQAPKEPIRLGLRDALGFMSSNAMTAGHAALLAVDARALHEHWLEVAALSFEALDADPVVLDARVQAAAAPGGRRRWRRECGSCSPARRSTRTRRIGSSRTHTRSACCRRSTASPTTRSARSMTWSCANSTRVPRTR